MLQSLSRRRSLAVNRGRYLLHLSEGRREKGASTSAGYTLAGGKLDLAWHSMNKTIKMMLTKILGINSRQVFFSPLAGVQRSAPSSSSPALRYSETFALFISQSHISLPQWLLRYQSYLISATVFRAESQRSCAAHLRMDL